MSWIPFTWIAFIGFVATTWSLIRLSIAFPAQIRQNWKAKSAEGLAPSMIYTTFVGYVLWTLYGWSKAPIDWPIAISSSIGTVLSVIIVFQSVYYGRKRKENKK